MKNKAILLSALFMSLMTIERAVAHCPSTVTYNEYVLLKNGQIVKGHKFEWVAPGFQMHATDILDEQGMDDEHYCGYLLPGIFGVALTTKKVDN